MNKKIVGLIIVLGVQAAVSVKAIIQVNKLVDENNELRAMLSMKENNII